MRQLHLIIRVVVALGGGEKIKGRKNAQRKDWVIKTNFAQT